MLFLKKDRICVAWYNQFCWLQTCFLKIDFVSDFFSYMPEQVVYSWKAYYYHCVKSVRSRSYYGPRFPAFGLNTERYQVSLRMQSECEKIRTRITPNTDTFHAVYFFWGVSSSRIDNCSFQSYVKKVLSVQSSVLNFRSYSFCCELGLSNITIFVRNAS